MNDAERRIISEFVERMAGAAPAAATASPWGGSVPATQARAPLPPVDREADALIGDLFARYPEARYRLTQTAFVQEAALIEAQNRIKQLEWEVENAQGQAQQPKGMLGGLFGGGAQRRPMAPPPQPYYPPGYNRGAMGGGGSGFLGSALTTAAGVAGGIMLGNMLMNSFGGGGHAQAASFDNSGAMGTGGGFGQEAVPTSSPWEQPSQASAWQSPGGGQDATGGYDSGNAGYDSGGFDDAGGGYDDDV